MTSSEHEFDRAIDGVAREMTAGDANANLRARVLAGIESPRPFAWRPVFATVCAGGAVVALIVVALNRPATSPGVPQTSANVPQTSPTVLTASPRVLPASPEMLTASPTVLAASPRVPASSRVPEQMLVNAFEQPPLKEESIAIESIAIAPMSPASIAVEELPTITPLAVPAIGQGEER